MDKHHEAICTAAWLAIDEFREGILKSSAEAKAFVAQYIGMASEKRSWMEWPREWLWGKPIHLRMQHTELRELVKIVTRLVNGGLKFDRLRWLGPRSEGDAFVVYATFRSKRPVDHLAYLVDFLPKDVTLGFPRDGSIGL